LKTVLLGQFGKSKWQSYFELLRLPMGHARPQAQHSHGETQTTPASKSSSRHRSFHGHFSHSPAALHERSGRRRKPQDSRGRLVGCSRRPRHTEVGALLPLAGRRATKGTATPVPKVTRLPALLSTFFRTLPMACTNFTIITPIEHTGVLHPALSRKLKCSRTLSSSAAIPAHATTTAMHFPANARLIFLTDKLTNDRFLVDTGATLSIIPCTSNSSPSGPLLKGADGQPILSWGFIQRTVQFQGKLFTSSFLQAAVAGPILGIDFLRKFKVKVVPETSHVLFACNVAALSVPPRLPSSVPEAVPPLARPTSSQPPAISAQLVGIPR
jgi:hypothetical protein